MTDTPMDDDPFDAIAPEDSLPEPDSETDLPPEAKGAGYPLNDVGNAQRFVLYRGADLLHVPRVGWYVWTGQRWRLDPDQISVRREAQALGGLILEEVPHVWRHQSPADLEAMRQARAIERDGAGGGAPPPAPEVKDGLESLLARAAGARKRLAQARDRHETHARTTGNKSRIDAVLVESTTSLSQDLELLDADALAVNTESGVLRFSVVDLEGGGRVADVRLDPHARGDMITKMMPVAYDPNARAPRFEAFLKQVQPDPEMRMFLQRWLGLSMSGLKHQQLCFWFGGGNNGKSVLIQVIARMLGDYAATAKIESLIGGNRRSGGDATPDLVPLIGARLVRASEPEKGERLQEGKIKEMTGGEPILVRALHADFVEVMPIFKLTVSGNAKPEIRGDDDGIWRRILLVPWSVQIPKEQVDPLLEEKLWPERDGIMNWLIDGLVQFLEGGLQPPETVSQATAEYRRDQDPTGRFLADCTVFTGDPNDVIWADELTKRFAYWFLETDQGAWKTGTLARRLSDKAGTWRHPKGGRVMSKGKSSRINYSGVRMVDDFERRFQAAPKDHAGVAIAIAEAVQP